MTERIPNPERNRKGDSQSKIHRVIPWAILGIALAALFAGVVLAMLHALPGPHTQADYMIAGGLATMVAMLALFAALVSTRFRTPDPFYKRRPKD